MYKYEFILMYTDAGMYTRRICLSAQVHGQSLCDGQAAADPQGHGPKHVGATGKEKEEGQGEWLELVKFVAESFLFYGIVPSRAFNDAL